MHCTHSGNAASKDCFDAMARVNNVTGPRTPLHRTMPTRRPNRLLSDLEQDLEHEHDTFKPHQLYMDHFCGVWGLRIVRLERTTWHGDTCFLRHAQLDCPTEKG